ncbi:hypothetical protein BIV57_20240 [Mangrovactinospora gilvigrisea]|uniref:Uncharacterized protein n=1 Tax=Mangrovactinospora gilvigrisea TaxID=1428644 RepID=A0A1J7C294_9ACTN|nr:DUF6886 family protein [Mangrovactinospora gilvigrisea]OIV35688.1 hypothetical protein BIV57_20240 [Mangrovactinospora gilvigrisea]
MRPAPGEVLHFSEDPTITRFVPHIAATARERSRAFVWAVDAELAPQYWFPRQCPRATAWALPGITTDADRERIIGPGCGDRVHAIELDWAERFLTVELYAYRLPAAAFRPHPDPAESDERPSALVATEPVDPLGPPQRVPDLLELHRAAGIQLRLLDNLRPFWDAVVASTLDFGGIRLRNAIPRPAPEE